MKPRYTKDCLTPVLFATICAFSILGGLVATLLAR